jgi:hypothetical protein
MLCVDVCGHTSGKRANMHAKGASLIRRLRAVNNVNMPAFLEGDLQCGQSFEDMH